MHLAIWLPRRGRTRCAVTRMWSHTDCKASCKLVQLSVTLLSSVFRPMAPLCTASQYDGWESGHTALRWSLSQPAKEPRSGHFPSIFTCTVCQSRGTDDKKCLHSPANSLMMRQYHSVVMGECGIILIAKHSDCCLRLQKNANCKNIVCVFDIGFCKTIPVNDTTELMLCKSNCQSSQVYVTRDGN